MSDKLHFSLVSPEREVFSGDVDQVDAPGSEGMFGVLPNHAPFMTTLKAGVVTVIDSVTPMKIFVRGGFADVTPQGLTILAEEAIDLKGFDIAASRTELESAKDKLTRAKDEHEKEHLEERIAYLEALVSAAA